MTDLQTPEDPLAKVIEKSIEKHTHMARRLYPDVYATHVAADVREWLGAPQPVAEEQVRQAKADAWDEAMRAVQAYFATPDEERGVLVNPYGEHPADRILRAKGERRACDYAREGWQKAVEEGR